MLVLLVYIFAIGFIIPLQLLFKMSFIFENSIRFKCMIFILFFAYKFRATCLYVVNTCRHKNKHNILLCPLMIFATVPSGDLRYAYMYIQTKRNLIIKITWHMCASLCFNIPVLWFLQIEAEFRVENADKPGHAIVDVAQKENATFVVTGTRGMGKFRRTIMGSVSDFVVHHAHCPVLVCRHKDK